MWAAFCRHGLAMGHGFEDVTPYPKAETAIAAWSASLQKLLQSSGSVSLHAGWLAATDGRIDEAALRRTKKTAYLINARRGLAGDLRTMTRALQEGWSARMSAVPSHPRLKARSCAWRKGSIPGTWPAI